MTEGPIDTSSISTWIPKFARVLLITFAFVLISPTPGFPESFSRKDVPSVPSFSQMMFGERIANKLFKSDGKQSKKDDG